jgi:SulP family sulfate permease
MKNYFKGLTPALVLSLKNYNIHTLTKDLIAGLIVGIIALPLSLALAIASGAKPEVGLLTAIIGGGVAALLSGSRNQVSGPTAAFIPIVLSVAATCGPDGFLTAIFFSGVLLVLMGLFKLGKLINYIALPIIAGFTAGIAVSIFTGQLADFMGYTGVPKEFFDKISFYIEEVSMINPLSLMLGILCVEIMLILPKITKKIPGALIAILFAVMMQILFKMDIATIGSRFGALHLEFKLHAFDFSHFSDLIVPILSIALLAAIESLLSAKAADSMTKTTHNPNAELISQGAANMASSLFGGLPVTGAIARTSASIKNGGQTPVSTIVHALLILLIGVLLMPYAVYIPLTALAAVLIVVCKNMINVKEIRKIFSGSPRDILLFFTALSLTVIFDLVVAIGVGMGIALLWVLMGYLRTKKRKLSYKPHVTVTENGDTATVEIAGGLNFITVPKFRINELNINASHVVIDLRKAIDIDVQGFEVVEHLIKELLLKGKETIRIAGNLRCMTYLAKSDMQDKTKVDLSGILVEEQSSLVLTSTRKHAIAAIMKNRSETVM